MKQRAVTFGLADQHKEKLPPSGWEGVPSRGGLAQRKSEAATQGIFRQKPAPT